MSDKSILLVDDDPDIRILLESSLRQLGCDVTSVGDGSAGLKKAANKKFGLIILDWHMPDLDGFEVATRIWTESVINKDTKIIMFTSADTADEVERCKKHGFADVLSKAFDLTRLQQLLAMANWGQPTD